MLLAVGTSVAMADGDSRLKKLATFICPPADEDGIADSLKKMGVL
ncbi:MAG: HAD hydrolase family protein, partial [Spirochaetales bacterium]|nr:HAD hydrolase family protein [Spirochaetales bacterium]